jgi:hypothetical protein
MKVKGLDGRIYTWHLVSSPKEAASAGHIRARELLCKLFPLDPRLEEVRLPGTGSLTADFYLPARKLLIEVQGVQHERYVSHFHKHVLGFWRSRNRDGRKRAWAELNGLSLVELPYDGTDGEWAELIEHPGPAQENGGDS